jgi:LmbE family N-acetylglucosaminyl deacetylase
MTMKIMVIAAHTDDFIYGLAGTLLTHQEDEKRLLVLSPIQETGAREVAKELGAEIQFLDGQYRALAKDSDRLRTQITEALRAWMPDYVFAPPSQGDWSPDHSTAGRLALEAAVESGVFGQWRGHFLRYPIPSSTQGFSPNIWISLPHELLERKIDLGAVMTRGAEGLWPREVVEWEVNTQMRFAQQSGWPVRHVEAFDALHAIPLKRLPPREPAAPGALEASMRLVKDFRAGNDYSRGR